MKLIQLDSTFRIRVSGSDFTMENLKDVTNKKTKKVRQEWTANGYHGSMKAALRGYVRHSIDTCDSVIDILATLDKLDGKVKSALTMVKK